MDPNPGATDALQTTPRPRPWKRWLLRGLLVTGLLIVVVGTGLFFYVRSHFKPSGGPLSENQASWDIERYDLEIEVFPETKTIAGLLTARARVEHPIETFELHLSDELSVEEARVGGEPAKAEHRRGSIAVELPRRFEAGEEVEVSIRYGGAPKVALRPPWIDGFVWSETEDGRPWIGVTAQGDGADNWFPCKDHPSDEPDRGFGIELTVPEGLVGLSNGRKLGEDTVGGKTTSRWESTYPINNYVVTLNIAPYESVSVPYQWPEGETDDLVFWVLPEKLDQAETPLAKLPSYLDVLGARLGPYPFRRDKLWVAHAPYYGMEHQTLIAYGASFEENEYGFDSLLLHELAHEWWGNNVSVGDWADFWLQEGPATYTEALYVEDTLGRERYLDFMAQVRQGIRFKKPLIQGENLTSHQAYIGDLYSKGAWVFHTLRWVIGDGAFYELLFRFQTEGPYAYAIVSTADFTRLAAEVSGLDLDWFWNRYLHRAEAPVWSLERSPIEGSQTEHLTLRWDDPGFEMPLPVSIDGEIQRVVFAAGEASLEIPAGAQIEVDPEGWVLAEGGG